MISVAESRQVSHRGGVDGSTVNGAYCETRCVTDPRREH